MPGEEWIDAIRVRDLFAAAGVMFHGATLQRLRDRGKLRFAPATQPGRRKTSYVYDRASVESYLAAAARPSVPPAQAMAGPAGGGAELDELRDRVRQLEYAYAMAAGAERDALLAAMRAEHAVALERLRAENDELRRDLARARAEQARLSVLAGSLTDALKAFTGAPTIG